MPSDVSPFPPPHSFACCCWQHGRLSSPPVHTGPSPAGGAWAPGLAAFPLWRDPAPRASPCAGLADPCEGRTLGPCWLCGTAALFGSCGPGAALGVGSCRCWVQVRESASRAGPGGRLLSRPTFGGAGIACLLASFQPKCHLKSCA